MTVPQPDARKPDALDEFAAGAANAAQLVPDEPPVEQAEGCIADTQPEEAVEQETAIRRPLQTREAYLKKGEDLIRSLL